MIHAARTRLDAPPDEGILRTLTAAERDRLAAVTRPDRRQQLIVSRALAKRLFVEMLDGKVIAAAGSRGGAIPEVRLEVPRACEAERQRDVEVGRASPDEARPTIVDGGAVRRDVNVSIAHADGWATVALSTTAAIGVDVARDEPRCPSFYRAHFTTRERAWVKRAHEAHRETLHTLLWTLKESVLKSGIASGVTLWGYDEIELALDVPACDLGDRYRMAGETANGVIADGLPVQVSVAGRASRSAHVWITRSGETVFSLVTLGRAAA